jgi:hypothetical protein
MCVMMNFPMLRGNTVATIEVANQELKVSSPSAGPSAALGGWLTYGFFP